ncbi:MAG: hypothetical protein Q9163_005563, partial [Psora crenata]
MCIHHYYHHRPCGHLIKNHPLSLHHHCQDLERALRYYHDQPKYLLLDQELQNRYGIPVSEQFKTPTACPEIWPPVIRDPEEQESMVSQYARWAQQAMDVLYNYQRNYGETPAVAHQRFLTEQSESRLEAIARMYLDPRHIPYPLDQAEHIMSFLERQHDPGAQPVYNVLLHTVPWGCGRSNSSACLMGHNIPNGPLCPYLLASRLPRDRMTPEAMLLCDFTPVNRGGASNDTRHSAKDKRFIRSALGIDQDGDLCPLPLDSAFLESIQRVGQVKTGSLEVSPEMWYFYVSGEMPPPGL